jgi:hypothetical protein
VPAPEVLCPTLDITAKTRIPAIQPAKVLDRLTPWLAPDAALTFALLTMLSLFFMFHGATGLFSDTDTGWHIRLGERILATGLLPHADSYSFSKPGQPWIAWEWGADVLMAWVYRAAGLAGIALLFGSSIGAAVWIWFRLNRAAAGNFLIAFLLFVPTVSTTALHWLARPHIFSWLFLLATVWLCERMPRRLGWRNLLLVATGAALWSNLHASFFLGPVIALIYAAGAWLGPLIWESGSSVPRARNFIRIALFALLGSFANPNGWKLHQHVVSYLANSALLDRISEFQSFNFHDDGALRVMLTLAFCAAGAFAALVTGRPARFLLSVLLIAMALRSVRALPLAALLLLPLANASLTQMLADARSLVPGLRRRLDWALQYGDRLQTHDRRLRGFAIAPLFALLIFIAIRADAGFSNNDAPVAASAAIASLPASARVLATDSFGGYLIYRFSGERQVFFDGRSDFYGKEFLDSYLRMVEVRPGWREVFDRWHFTHALLPPDCSLVAALRDGGWRELFRDRTAVLLAAPR